MRCAREPELEGGRCVVEGDALQPVQPLSSQVAIVKANPRAGGHGPRDGRLSEIALSVGHADAEQTRPLGRSLREQRPRHVDALGAQHADHQRGAAVGRVFHRRLQAAGGQRARGQLQRLHHELLGARMQLVGLQSGAHQEFLERVQFLPLRKQLQILTLIGFFSEGNLT